jgi:hypothetical protein
MLRRIPQPPINPASRAPERHGFWPGCLVTLLGLGLTVAGARHMTGLDTKEGGKASEIQLVKAYSASGLEYADHQPPPSPPKGADPEALERWLQENLHPAAPTWKVRIDTEAKAACPT